MNRKSIVRKLKKAGYKEVHGGKHDMFVKPGSPPIAVPRHNEIPKGTALKILKQAGIKE